MKGGPSIPAALLTEEMVDPLIRETVARINRSGWVETALSCQGHPEDPTDANQRPMLRLRCAYERRGELLTRLMDATSHRAPWDGSTYAASLELWQDPWQDPQTFMVTVHVTAISHSAALGVLTLFAYLVSDN